jgi:hypothetical protein
VLYTRMNKKLKTKNKINFNTKIGGTMKIKLDFMHVYLFCFIFDFLIPILAKLRVLV